MTDRLEVTFHPSMPEASQRLMAALDVDVRFNERAPRVCDCEVVLLPGELAARVRACLRDAVCPTHNEKWISVRGGARTCRSCERDAVSPNGQAV